MLFNHMSDLKNKHSDLEKKVTDLEESVKFNEEDISEVRIDRKKNEVEIEEVRKQVVYLETYSRENIKFVGIAEEIKNTQGQRTPRRLFINSWKNISKLKAQGTG